MLIIKKGMGDDVHNMCVLTKTPFSNTIVIIPRTRGGC